MRKMLLSKIVFILLFCAVIDVSLKAQTPYTGDLNVSQSSTNYTSTLFSANTRQNTPVNTEWWHMIEWNHDANGTTWNHQLALDYFTDNMYFRRKSNASWQGWNKIWHSGNLNRSDVDFTAKSITSYSDISVGNINDKTTGYGAKLYLNGLSEAGCDPVWMSKYIVSQDNTELRISIGDNDSGDDKFAIGSTFWEDGQFKPWLTVFNNGNVQIGTTNTTGNLIVNGNINATEVNVKSDVWSDFVFDKDYKLRDLKEVDQYIQDNGHLPEIPSAAEVKEKGVNIVEVQAKLLQKVEEMTLYILAQEKKMKAMQARIDKLESGKGN